jgi:hypothetical protein
MKIEKNFNSKSAPELVTYATANARHDHVSVVFWPTASEAERLRISSQARLCAQLSRDEALRFAALLINEALRVKA